VPVERSRSTARYAYYATQPSGTASQRRATQPSGTASQRRAGRSFKRLVALAPILVGVGGVVLLTQGGRWTGWTLVGFVIAGLGAIASMIGLVGLARRGHD
jgi:hypothetical protein